MLPPRRAFAAWAALTLLGAAILALPDPDRRVFSLSKDHGPGPMDLLGVGLAMGGLALYVAGLVAARRALRRRDVAVALPIYLLGSAVAVGSALTDTGAWWALGIVLAYGGMAFLAWRVTR